MPGTVIARAVNREESVVIQEVITAEEARRVSDFLLSQESFDSRLTPGEEEDARIHPMLSIQEEKSRYWYVENERGEIIAVNGVKENEHKNDGYIGAFLAVSKKYREMGIAKRMFDLMLKFVVEKKGRYILIDTSDKDEYKTIRFFLESRNFRQVGYFPNHYYEGEGTYWYYKGFAK
jgi:ribosomal protein S18 acetylase RimI-like enzyme